MSEVTGYQPIGQAPSLPPALPAKQARPAGASFGKPDATGRSSGKLASAERKLLGPPKGQAWAWLTAELLASDAWRGMSIHCRRFIDFLMLEHCNNAGRENGRLQATYAQLSATGLKRKNTKAAISEAVERGLVRVTVTGGLHGIEARRTPSRYRLTWAGCIGRAQPATNEWQCYKNHFSAYALGNPIAYPRGNPTEIENMEIRQSRKWRPPTPGVTASRSWAEGPDENGARAERDRLKAAYASKHGRWPKP